MNELNKMKSFKEIKQPLDNLTIQSLSYKISELIAKNSKPFNEGEFIKECLLTFINLIAPEKKKYIEELPLSRNTVTRRIQEISKDYEEQLKMKANEFIFFSIAMDESLDITDIPQRVIFIRGVDRKFKITEEMLDIWPMHGKTTGADFAQLVDMTFEKFGLEWNKLCSIATDGAKAMIGKNKGAASILKQKSKSINPILNIKSVHCLLHRQALVGKIIKLNNILETVCVVVNKLRKSCNHREFREFLENNEEDFNEIPYFTSIRWLSCGVTLKRFFDLRLSIVEYLKEKGEIIYELEDENWISDLAFLSDIFQHMNALNIQLQGKNKLITEMIQGIKNFIGKLNYMKIQLRDNRLDLFDSLRSIFHSNREQNSIYIEIISEIVSDFKKRFNEIEDGDKEFILVTHPFSVDFMKYDDKYQMEIIILQSDLSFDRLFTEIGTVKFIQI